MADLWVLTVSEAFDAAHFLPGYNGPCGNLHGHTWRIEATWAYNTLSAGDMCERSGGCERETGRW
jgi:6-pyruvoyl-tetrahydropterin synthase